MRLSPTETAPVLSVVSPVYGCRGCLEELVDSLAANVQALANFEVILVDDASPDQSWPRIQELAQTRPWLRGVRLARNFGQHSAISAGIELARGEWVVVMDCDLQDPPAAIPALYRKAVDEQFDTVFAQRINRKDSWSKRLASWGFFKLLGWLTNIPQDSSTANFGIFHRKVINAVCSMPERDRCFPLMVKWAGFRSTAIPVEHAKRQVGQSTYDLRKMVKLAMGIALSYSEKPLRMVASSGLVAALIAFVMVGYSILRWMAGDVAVAGFTSIIASLWLVGGLILFSMGIVGLYVGQVFRNAQGRPSFIISESVN